MMQSRLGALDSGQEIPHNDEVLVSTTSPTSACARCLVCHSNRWTLLREGTDLCRPEYRRVFRLMRCSHCGHTMQNPIPSDRELEAAYAVSADYACYRPAWKEQGWPIWKWLRLWTTSRRIAHLKRYTCGTELLEVGCGAGDFLVAASRSGWNSHAVEYNGQMAEEIRNAFGIDVRTGEFEAETWNEKHFDVVAFWNVLEHVQNPIHELALAGVHLRANGRVLLNIPTRQAVECGQWFSGYWALLDLPRHIHFFDRASLTRICEKAGMNVLFYRTPFVQSAWCYYMSCKNWAVAARRNWLSVLRALLGAVLVTLLLPYIALRCFSGRGVEAFAVLVKSE